MPSESQPDARTPRCGSLARVGMFDRTLVCTEPRSHGKIAPSPGSSGALYDHAMVDSTDPAVTIFWSPAPGGSWCIFQGRTPDPSPSVCGASHPRYPVVRCDRPAGHSPTRKVGILFTHQYQNLLLWADLPYGSIVTWEACSND
jgi:hypothetical protein